MTQLTEQAYGCGPDNNKQASDFFVCQLPSTANTYVVVAMFLSIDDTVVHIVLVQQALDITTFCGF